MCGRYYVAPDDPEIARLIAQLESGSPAGAPLAATGEITPGMVAPILSLDEGALVPKAMRWGFSGVTGKGLLINARSETVLEKPSFSRAMAQGRCLVPASWYIEWQTLSAREKVRHAMRPLRRGPVMMAGLFDRTPDSELARFVILTRPAAPEISVIHDRMPLILNDAAQRAWLTGPVDMPLVLQGAETDIRPVVEGPAQMMFSLPF